MSLFSASEFVKLKHDPRLARCGHCGRYKGCDSPKMPVTGKGRLGVLVVAEAPGREEDRQSKQLVGPAGQTLRRYLKKLDVDLDQDCWKTNVVICHSERNPTHDEILDCRSNLLGTIRELNPRMILLLGGSAISSLIGWLWKENPGEVGRWTGWRIPSQQLNAWVCPSFDPSYVMRCENNRKEQSTRNKETGQVASIMFREHLRQAFESKDRPWKKLPEYEKQVRVEMDCSRAAAMVRRYFCSGETPVSFDYETNMLKPESELAEIVSCSMSNGEKTIAFPIMPETHTAVEEFLRSPVPKIAHNMKFEDRWSRSVMKTSVRRWHWCTMQTEHVLDNRRGITSLKFLAFACLGQASYNENVSSYLEGSPNTPNRIRQTDMRNLLLYNGLDSLLTWHLFRKQENDLKGISL